jgi:hypothetical protein
MVSCASSFRALAIIQGTLPPIRIDRMGTSPPRRRK